MTRSRPPTVGAYRDCAQVMDAILEKGAANVPFPTRGAAINFRQRCYKLRQIHQAASLKAGAFTPSSPYDAIFIRLVPLKAEEGVSNFLEFRIRDSGAIEMQFTGEGPTLGSPETDEDDLKLEAGAFARKLGLIDE